MDDDIAQKHTHHASYTPHSIVEAIDSLPGEVLGVAHQLIMVHTHDAGNMPHHHMATDETTGDSKPKVGVWSNDPSIYPVSE
jgi:hypothetical protein